MPDDVPSAPVILRATARHRAVVCYGIDPARLAPHLPASVEPDTHDGTAYLCLIGTQLVGVRVLGLSGPGFRRVPAVELQAAVRSAADGRPGTFTAQAYVPRHLVAWAARTCYHEPVAGADMQPVRRPRGERVEMTYRFDWRGREQRLRVVGPDDSPSPASDGFAAFVRGRSWRYSAEGDGTLYRTHIARPEGHVRPAEAHHVTMRWRAVFGDVGTLLRDRTPAAAWLAPGGEMALRWRERVRPLGA